jgi:hypothetical protein
MTRDEIAGDTPAATGNAERSTSNAQCQTPINHEQASNVKVTYCGAIAGRCFLKMYF